MSDDWGHDPKEIADWLAARKKPIRSNSGVVNFLYTYLDDPSEIMSKARVNETIAEIETLQSQHNALRELLELSRPYVGQADGLLADRIDAFLKGIKND